MPGATETTLCWMDRRTFATRPAGAADSSAGKALCAIASASAFAGAIPAKLAVERLPSPVAALLIPAIEAVELPCPTFAAATCASCLASLRRGGEPDAERDHHADGEPHEEGEKLQEDARVALGLLLVEGRLTGSRSVAGMPPGVPPVVYFHDERRKDRPRRDPGPPAHLLRFSTDSGWPVAVA